MATMGSLADNIIALTKHNSEDGKKDMKKSAIRGFASEILLLVIRSSDNVQFLRRYGTQLITIAPLADPVVFTEEGIPVLAGLVRQRLEQSEAEQSSQQTKSESILSSELNQRESGKLEIYYFSKPRSWLLIGHYYHLGS